VDLEGGPELRTASRIYQILTIPAFDKNTKLEIYCSHVIRFPYKRIPTLLQRLPKGKPVSRQLWWVDT